MYTLIWSNGKSTLPLWYSFTKSIILVVKCQGHESYGKIKELSQIRESEGGNDNKMHVLDSGTEP